MHRVRPCGDRLRGADPNLHVSVTDRLRVTVPKSVDVTHSEHLPNPAAVADDRMG
jgi:hypothetical protein